MRVVESVDPIRRALVARDSRGRLAVSVARDARSNGADSRSQMLALLGSSARIVKPAQLDAELATKGSLGRVDAS